MPNGSSKRTIYDSVFCNLFQDPKYQLKVYQALHPEDQTVTEDDIQDVTLEAIFLDQMYNDLGFTVRSTRIILLEAMSTWSRNITIRSLMYLGESYLEYLHRTKQNYYRDTPVKLPKPEVYMLYTGSDAHEEKYISLADVYWEGDSSVLDLKVKVLYGKENEEENTILTQYVKFTQIYRKNVAIYGKTREAVIVTLKECKEQGILVDYINEHEVEVIDVMMALYDRETYMELYDAQKEKESNFKLLASLVKDGLLSISEAAKRSNLSETEFRNKAALPVA